MGKNFISYILILFFSGLVVNGFAATPQIKQITVAEEVNVKTWPFADIPLHNSAKESFTCHVVSIAPSVIAAHLIAENLQIVSFAALYTGKIISIPVTKPSQNNCLLHLFPSHYFW
jgi:hypothetical protein